jgi:hypothetical protein
VNIWRSQTQVPAVSLSLPAGSYALSAKASVGNLSGTLQGLGCRLNTGDESSAAVADGTGQIVALQDVVTLASPSTVTLTCDHGSFVGPGSGAPSLGTASSGVITAITIDGVN